MSTISRVSVLAGFCACVAAAHANPVTFNLNTEFNNGDPPPYVGNLATVTITNITGGVEVSMTAVKPGAKLFAVYLNIFNNSFNPVGDGTSAIGGLTVDHVSGTTASITKHYSETAAGGIKAALKADGDGYFDLKFDFGGTGLVGATTVYEVLGSVTSSDFVNYSSGSGSHLPQFPLGLLVAGHVGNATQTGGSLWVTDGPETLIPLPTTGGLALAGLLAVSGIRRRRSV